MTHPKLRGQLVVDMIDRAVSKYCDLMKNSYGGLTHGLRETESLLNGALEVITIVWDTLEDEDREAILECLERHAATDNVPNTAPIYTVVRNYLRIHTPDTK